MHHQNFSTNPSGLQDTPHGIPRGREIGGAVPIAVFWQRKTNKKKLLNFFCGGAFICRFSLSVEVFETQSL
jgi:hypothetical protein